MSGYFTISDGKWSSLNSHWDFLPLRIISMAGCLFFPTGLLHNKIVALLLCEAFCVHVPYCKYLTMGQWSLLKLKLQVSLSILWINMGRTATQMLWYFFKILFFLVDLKIRRLLICSNWEHNQWQRTIQTQMEEFVTFIDFQANSLPPSPLDTYTFISVRWLVLRVPMNWTIVRGSKDSIGQMQPVSLLVLLWPRWLDGLIGHRWPSSLRVKASSDWCVCVCVCVCVCGTLDPN